MGRIAIAVFILVFWLSWPVIPTMLQVSSGVGADYDSVLGDAKEDAFNVQGVGQVASLYTQFLTFTIPDMPIVLRFIGWILTGLGILAIAFFIRG